MVGVYDPKYTRLKELLSHRRLAFHCLSVDFQSAIELCESTAHKNYISRGRDMFCSFKVIKCYMVQRDVPPIPSA